MKHLNHKRALVTGAAGGIGRAIALELAQSGVDLLVADVNAVGLERTRRDAEDTGVECHAVYADLAARGEVARLASEALDRWAGVDVLVNNAGVTYHGPTHTMPPEEIERLLDINLRAKLQLTRALLPSLIARPEAHVLNVCSVLGLSGMPRVAAYCTTKFAMVGFSEALRSEYGRVGLGVTALCPGFVSTGLFSAARPERDGGPTKAPPALLCVTPERVARQAVRAIRRNRGRVVIDPIGGPIHGLKRLAPVLFDVLLSLGRNKRVRRKADELAALHSDQDQALRIKLGLSDETAAEQRRAA
ncbi:MAG: SDR family NAD(P)-dependent oxidoreductase [Planctomycetota bacterium]